MKKLLTIALVALAVASCKQTEYVTVERVRTDTVRITRNTRDSIYLHDSVFVNQYQRGETVYVEKEKWHTRYQDRLLLDTIYQSRTDSVPVPYPVEKLVEKQLSWWQHTQMYAGDALLLVLLGGAVYGAIRLKKAIL